MHPSAPGTGSPTLSERSGRAEQRKGKKARMKKDKQGSARTWPAQLGRGAEQKPATLSAIALDDRHQDVGTCRRRPGPKGGEVHLQSRTDRVFRACPSDPRQIIARPQDRMRTPEPLVNYGQPAGYQPGCDQAVRIHLQAGSVKPPPAPPAMFQNQKDRPYDRIHRVLHIGNQLLGKKGEGSPLTPAQEPGDRNTPLLKRIQLDGMSPIRLHRPVAVLRATDRAVRPQVGEKIDLFGQKRSFVFPKRGKSVTVGYLNRALPGSRGGGAFWPPKPSGSPPRRAWLFFHGKILTSLFRPLLYHRSILSANLPSPPRQTMCLPTGERLHTIIHTRRFSGSSCGMYSFVIACSLDQTGKWL